MRLARLCLPTLACLGTAAAWGQTPARPSVAVVIRGDSDSAGRVRIAVGAETSLPVDIQLDELPSGAATSASEATFSERIALARRAYVSADFSRCLSGLGDDALVPGLLANGQRSAAARVLLWRTGCNVGGGHPADALRSARELAAFQLDVPADVASLTPEVEAVIARAMKDTEAAPRVPIAISSPASSGALTIDGRPAACSLPCKLELTKGAHVIRLEADGLAPQTRVVRVDTGVPPVAFGATPASPEAAARQWIARYAGSTELDSAPSLRLLSTALRASRLVLLTVEREGDGARLRGALAVDQDVVARGERSSESNSKLEPSLDGLLRDLLVRGKVVEPAPALYQRPLFWISVATVAVLAGGTVFYFQERAQNPPVHLSF